MSQLEEVALDEELDSTIQPTAEEVVWLDFGDDIEVLRLDTEGKRHLARGVFSGLAISGDAIGGPVQFVLDGPDGETWIYADEVAGITPAPAPRKVSP